MTGTATRYEIPTLTTADLVRGTPAWTESVATKLAGIMDGGHLTPTYSAGWRAYHNPAIYQVTLELDSAARRVHVVGLIERQGGPVTLTGTLVPAFAIPASPSLNPAADVTGMTWGSGGWVRWVVQPGTGGAGPTLSVMSPGASFGTQHAYQAGDFIATAGITWRYP